MPEDGFAATLYGIITDPFMLTVIIIVVSTLVIAVIRRLHIDKCLKDFKDDFVTLILEGNVCRRGKLDVESIGLELLYPTEDVTADQPAYSYILYKEEYAKILVLARFHEDLSEKNRCLRDREMQRTYHPGFWLRMKRKTGNFFKTIKDSLTEIFNQFSTQLKANNTSYANQEKMAKQVNQELVGSWDATYNTLLEKYIGNLVVVEYKSGALEGKFTGVLKEYTAQYLEILDVMLDMEGNGSPRAADVVIPVNVGRIRHVGERVQRFNIRNMDFDIRHYIRYHRRHNRQDAIKKENKREHSRDKKQ